eukprot:TRINITY_DN33794_c0_g1_i1.p2 TRINITY_DN33794_c0_g1~~TRINITY_DN33794_c0_g1_i1.p2  ORF type:complete len:296 (+),score=53.40 TRINITY_DN33794_c0_g1_i1:1-888(+)
MFLIWQPFLYILAIDLASEPQQQAKLLPPSDNPLFNEPIQVDQKPTYTVGRDAHMCDISLSHRTVSRVHAGFVHHTEGKIYLIDNMSTHGTLVNGKKIQGHKPLHLRDGYKIQFGQDKSNRFVFKCEEVKRKASDFQDQDYVQMQQQLRQLQQEIDKEDEEQNGILGHDGKRVKIDATLQILENLKSTSGLDDSNFNDQRRVEYEDSKQSPKEIQASHILIKHRDSRKPSSWLEEVVTRSEEEAVQIALQMHERLATGEVEFAVLAEECSHCSSHRRLGGILDDGGNPDPALPRV